MKTILEEEFDVVFWSFLKIFVVTAGVEDEPFIKPMHIFSMVVIPDIFNIIFRCMCEHDGVKAKNSKIKQHNSAQYERRHFM